MNKKLDQQYWADRYQNGETGWDAGKITSPLKSYFDQLNHKEIRILIPGAGNAHEAEYLIHHNFSNVTVCDLALAPLMALQQRCPAMKAEHLLQGDFFEIKDREFDLIVEQTFFCAIAPALRKNYFTKMLELLVPGGRLAGLLFNDVLNSDFPPFGGTKEEYLTYIPEGFHILTFETCTNSIAPRQGRELFIELQKNDHEPA